MGITWRLILGDGSCHAFASYYSSRTAACVKFTHCPVRRIQAVAAASSESRPLIDQTVRRIPTAPTPPLADRVFQRTTRKRFWKGWRNLKGWRVIRVLMNDTFTTG